ncbi:dynein axonemal intermediate chain 4-like [Eurosta solidaginis]|uniref:dynein axonemal intermediate chain 4-like n=1 Tax=Eurosta solidaginis TaxID=178769 RepID=UPI003530DCA8
MTEAHNPSMASSKRYSNSKSSTRFGRIPYNQVIESEIRDILAMRNQLKIKETIRGVVTDVTPKLLELEEAEEEKFKLLNSALRSSIYAYRGSSSHSSDPSRQSMASSGRGSISNKPKLGGLRYSLDDILLNVVSLHQVFRNVDEYEVFEEPKAVSTATRLRQHFIKVTLRKSEEFLLFEVSSKTERKGTAIGDIVEADNTMYDYLTVGRGMVRRRNEAETQTIKTLMKTRWVNTFYKEFAEKKSYVSIYELYDTYNDIAKGNMNGDNDFNNDSSSIGTKDFILSAGRLSEIVVKAMLNQIEKNPNFNFACMIMGRLLAGNIHAEGQREFRKMSIHTRADSQVEFCYDPKVLFIFNAPSFEASRITGKTRKAVADISFCYNNGDIIAVAYGVFSYSAKVTVTTGNVCIWSIKNPQNPEHTYNYNSPVTSVEFSPFLNSLLAIGLFDGAVEVRNITKPDAPPVAVTQRVVSPNRDPVIAMKWIKQPEDNTSDIDPLLTLSLNGSVWKYCIVGGPYLMSFNQLKLHRVEGTPEGLSVNHEHNVKKWYADNHPIGLNITLHPFDRDIYYLLTDEGCVYKCSTNLTQSYIEMWRAHVGSVNCMDFSPWSPKLFLTCGNDWSIRVWMESISKPLITLFSKMKPFYAAKWSRTHSTVIISVTRSHAEIWDIRRNLLEPISRIKFSTSFNTMFRFSLSGLSVAFGDERGDVRVCAFDRMPFPSYFQYDDLKYALFKALIFKPDMIPQLKSIGFFGYERKGYVRPP